MPFTNSTRGLFGAQSAIRTSAATSTILTTSVSPQIYWKNEDITGSDGSVTSTWINSGTFGSGYNGNINGSPTVRTWSGKKSVRLSNGNYLSHAARMIMNTSSFGNGFTLAVVYKTDSATQKFSLMGTNGIAPGSSNQYGIIGNRGGTGTQGQYMAWDNDGFPHATTSTGFSYSPDVTNIHQAVWRHTTGGTLQVWAPSKTSGNIYSSSIAPYTSQFSQHTVGWSRLNSPAEEPWDLLEYIFWDSALSDADVTVVRNYFGTKFAGLGVVNN
jgi:hypothetical protein